MRQVQSRKRNRLFLKTCEVICPEFLERQKPEVINNIGMRLTEISYKGAADITKMFFQANNFKVNYPQGKFVKEEIKIRPSRGKSTNDYCVWASKFIKKHSGVYLPASSIVPSTFYEAVINHCFNKE